MRVDILCSGSKGNSTLVRCGSTAILIDCGASSKRYQMNALEKVGCSLEDLDALLVTHKHSDHIKQLRFFADLPIYSKVHLHCVDPKKNPVPLNWHELELDTPFTIGQITITSFALSHDAGETTGFVLEGDHKRLVYVTDTGYVRQELYPLLVNANCYIFESNHDPEMLMHTARPMITKQRILSDLGHLCNEDSAHTLCHLIGADTTNIVLAHLSEQANTEQLALSTLKRVLEENGLDDLPITLQAARQNEVLSLESI